MKLVCLISIAGLLCFAQSNADKKSKHAAGESRQAHVAITPQQVRWAPAPPPTGLASAVQLAVLSGDPFKPGSLFTLRLKVPSGAKVAPHWHPGDEHVVIVQGTFAIGMGEKFDEAALHDLPTGSYLMLPKEMRHYGLTKGETIIQVYGVGPFILNYVNPADDPRKPPSS
jgi:hypothetical protein